jgi:ankyrin repeat protein
MLIDMPPETLRAIIPAVCSGVGLSIEGQVGKVIRRLSATLPMKQEDDAYSIFGRIVGTDYSRSSIEILKLTVFLLSNRLLYDEMYDLVCDELLKWFQIGDNYLLLKAILSHRLPTIEAFAEGIFASALEAEDRQMVGIFLDLGMNPNIMIEGGEEHERQTALQCVTQRSNLGLVELLLKFEADVDLTPISEGYYNSWLPLTPLQIAAENGSVGIARLLISRGATVDRPDKRSLSPLQLAAREGNTELVEMLLERGADINVQSGDYGSPLECAIRAGANGIVEILLKHGADIDPEPEHGAEYWTNTPLQTAVMIDNPEMAVRLLQLGANANAPASAPEDGGGRTALQWAAENGNLQLCQVLMEASADLNATPAVDGGITTLAGAVSSMNYELVQLLLKHGASVNVRYNNDYGRFGNEPSTALETAAKLNDTAMTRLLLSAGADPRIGQPVIRAVGKQNLELISMLLEAGADINKPEILTGQSALSEAVRRDNSHLVHFLLGAGANATPKLDDALDECLVVPIAEAARLGHVEMIEILLRAGADCNQQTRRPFNPYKNLNALQEAARSGNIGVVRRLLLAGAEVNYPAAPRYGRTALQAAVESQNRELIQLLVNQGADLNSQAAEFCGVTALQAAVDTRDAALVRFLLANGANANDAPSVTDGHTALQRAAANGDEELVRLLLDYGASINATAAHYSGRTALQAAAVYGHYQTVLLLLTEGANANAPACPEYGITALQAAAHGGYLHIAEVLLEAGANVNAQISSLYGSTALEAAAASGRIDMLKLLLNAGADITSDFGRFQLKLALDVATNNGHDAAAKFLKYHQIC